jgi:hypothetical protein
MATGGYRAPRWLPGGHAQTIWAALYARRVQGLPVAYQRERWATPDGDFVDVDFHFSTRREAPWLVLFHGLEGSSAATMRRPLPMWPTPAGWNYAAATFPRLLGRAELAPRAYHSGDHAEIGWILARRPAPARGAGASWWWGSRWAATRCCAGRKRPAIAHRPRCMRWPRCARRSTWPLAAMPSGAASTGRSTPACSCAP